MLLTPLPVSLSVCVSLVTFDGSANDVFAVRVETVRCRLLRTHLPVTLGVCVSLGIVDVVTDYLFAVAAEAVR